MNKNQLSILFDLIKINAALQPNYGSVTIPQLETSHERGLPPGFRDANLKFLRLLFLPDSVMRVGWLASVRSESSRLSVQIGLLHLFEKAT